MRGGKKPNYDTASIDEAASLLEAAKQAPRLMVDCSHSNSGKDHIQQAEVCLDVAKQVAAGDNRIMGLMLESHLVAGRQDLVDNKPVTYGQSITDACMDWECTVPLLESLANAVRERRRNT